MIEIGNAPCSWGVEFPKDPRNPPWRQVLKECAEAGYRGIELGPVGYMPENPVELAEALDEHGLTLIGGVVFRPFHDPDKWLDVVDGAERTCKALASHGAQHLVLIDSISARRAATAGRADEAEQMDPSGSRAGSFEGRSQDRVLREPAVADRVGDPHQFLIDDASGAEILVPHLGIAHHRTRSTAGQAHVLAAGGDERRRPFRREAIGDGAGAAQALARVEREVRVAAAVDVEGLAKVFLPHDGAFDVPAWPSHAPRRLPGGFAGLG